MSLPERKLSKRALELLDASDEERIKHIDKEVFISYKRAKEILDEMEELLAQPKTNRMSNILIVARSNNGKTELLKEFAKRHPVEDRQYYDTICAPVVYVQSPPGPSEHIFLDKFLMMLGAPLRENDSADRKLMQVMEILPRIQTKLLLIDELNALLAGSVIKQRYFLNMLKYLSNDLHIGIIAAGTREAEYAVNSDDQIKSRFPVRILPRWKEDNEFRKLLSSFEHILPLKQPSEIYKGEIASMLYGKSEGVIGEAAKIIRSAAKHAIQTKVERITMDVIAQCSYVLHKREDSSEAI